MITKTLSLTLTLAIAAVGFAAASSPTQAATRLMSSSLEGFEYRCEHHGGIFGQDGTLVSCRTPSVPVACEYFDDRQAVCEWPGILNQVAVIRVIGTLPTGGFGGGSSSNGISGGNGAGGNGGGFQGPGEITDVPNDDPNPGFEGPDDFQMAP
jgi:uncharacterized membrane protein YgcG